MESKECTNQFGKRYPAQPEHQRHHDRITNPSTVSSLVAAVGGNLVAAGGGNLVAAGGGN